VNHIDKYKRRLSRNGDDVGEVYSNNTIAFMENTFHVSPTFRVLEVLSSELPSLKQIDSRVVEVERMGNLREVLFRPNQGLPLGSYVKFDSETWLVFDEWGSAQSTKVKVMVQKCNRSIRWKDPLGNIIEYDCIASATALGSKSNQGKPDIEWNKYDVRLPLGQLFVFVEANQITRNINMNQRFIFGQSVYEVFGIDDVTMINRDGFGVIQLTIKLTTKQDGDDFSERIAVYNHKISEGDAQKGGRVW